MCQVCHGAASFRPGTARSGSTPPGFADTRNLLSHPPVSANPRSVHSAAASGRPPHGAVPLVFPPAAAKVTFRRVSGKLQLPNGEQPVQKQQ